MRERPILFSAPMVRAILDGRKTQTRRVVKRAHTFAGIDETAKSVHPDGSGKGWIAWFGVNAVSAEETLKRYPGFEGFPCPYGVSGDRLWVRETFGYVESIYFGEQVVYKAGGTDDRREPFRWRPSIHMPRWASRLTLAVESVRVERLNDISEEDARAEGVEPLMGAYSAGFAHLWTKINGERADWHTNPWVWVISFKQVPPGAAKEGEK